MIESNRIDKFVPICLWWQKEQCRNLKEVKKYELGREVLEFKVIETLTKNSIYKDLN